MINYKQEISSLVLFYYLNCDEKTIPRILYLLPFSLLVGL
jgi:hypothetical protein